MKQLIIALILVLATVSCTKQTLEIAPAKPAQETFFSRVKHFTDGRKPATDTVWTLRLTTDALVAQYRAQDGYVYESTSTYVDRGTLWTR